MLTFADRLVMLSNIKNNSYTCVYLLTLELSLNNVLILYQFHAIWSLF